MFQGSYFRQHPVLKCPLEINWICCYSALALSFILNSFGVYTTTSFAVDVTWDVVRDESLFCLFHALRINISRWGGSVVRSIGGFFVVLSERNCRELWRRCAVFITGRSVARRNKTMICPRMSHFVRFECILQKDENRSFNSRDRVRLGIHNCARKQVK